MFTAEEKILSAIRNACEALRLPFTPDVVLNGKRGFFGEDAEALIYAAAGAIGLSRNIVDEQFPYHVYFEPESSVSAWALTRRSTPPAQPLTARQLANILLEIGPKDKPADSAA
jgi:hypothetical protein